MQEGLEDKIRSVGHWRFNIRPTTPVDNDKRLLLGQAAEVVETSRVSLRGWDYPHVDRGSGHGGHGHVGEYVENWCDWQGHVEFWRMYRSTQFLHYRALWEDLQQIDHKPDGPVLSVLGAIYTVTEMIEFTYRLFQRGLYQSGTRSSVTLGNTKGRQLWISDGMRMPFFDAKRTQADALTVEREVPSERLAESPAEVSLEMLLELFDHFGWNPDPSLIRNDQTRFYNKQF